MSLHDVILSLLREPMSGSELIRTFRGSIQHFWHTDLSQIYRALDGLQRRGCLESEVVPTPRGPARKVYRLTAAGRERLAGWLRDGAELPPVKLEYLAKVFSATADPDPRGRAVELLEGMREEARRAVAVLERIDAAAREIPGYPDALPAEVFYPWLTVRHGLLRRRALLAWIDESLERLARRPADSDSVAPDATMAAMVEQMLLAANAPGEAEPGDTAAAQNEEDEGGRS